jgi:(2Fe-2S) ferredoxin
MKEKRQRLRLFVCMKTRTDGRSCCAHQGASIVLDELRRQIFERGETCSHIDVRPSGCLDRCEDGPVVMAFYGQLAEEATPSRELIKASLEDAAYTFTAVSARDVSAILDTVLEGRAYYASSDLIENSRREQRRLRCGSSR